jgi:DNA-binding LytR/AlgR family response regulator
MAMVRLSQLDIVSDHSWAHSMDSRFETRSEAGPIMEALMIDGEICDESVTQSESPRMTGEQAARLLETFPILKALAKRHSPRVAIKVKGSILFINPAEVIAVEAEGNYVLLYRGSSSYLLREALSVVEEKISPYGFIRIHRSVLVNTSFVEEIRPYPTGEYGLRMRGGKEYTVTRTYKKNLKALADYWIGAGTFFAA